MVKIIVIAGDYITNVRDLLTVLWARDAAITDDETVVAVVALRTPPVVVAVFTSYSQQPDTVNIAIVDTIVMKKYAIQ